MTYFLLKYTHIISATILFGTGIGSAFYMFAANLRKDVYGIYFATRHVVIADFLFTLPAVFVQLISGLGLVFEVGYDFSDAWLTWAGALYLLVVTCWIPVVFLQIKMRDMAKTAFNTKSKLPKLYWTMNLWWIILGAVAFVMMLIIFFLMVEKPV